MTTYQPYILCEESPCKRIFNYYDVKCDFCKKRCQVRADFFQENSHGEVGLYTTRCPYPDCRLFIYYRGELVVYKEDAVSETSIPSNDLICSPKCNSQLSHISSNKCIFILSLMFLTISLSFICKIFMKII
jgi:hypothetical protein